jgi:hypothetical protein
LNAGRFSRALAFSSGFSGNWEVFDIYFDRLWARNGSLTIGKAVYLSFSGLTKEEKLDLGHSIGLIGDGFIFSVESDVRF